MKKENGDRDALNPISERAVMQLSSNPQNTVASVKQMRGLGISPRICENLFHETDSSV